MVTTTARQLVTGSLRLIGVLGAGEPATAADADDSLWTLNSLIDSWGTQPQTMYAIGRTVTSCASGAASYTIGDTTPASDFPQVRPIWVDAAAYLDPGASSPSVEIPIPVITEQMYQAQQVKDLENALPSTLYYEPSTPEAGTIILWPILTQTVDIVLYTPTAITQFPDLTTSVKLAPGYERALRYGLAVELIPEYGRPTHPLVERTARQALEDVKRANFKPSDLSVDPGLLHNPTAGWDIYRGP